MACRLEIAAIVQASPQKLTRNFESIDPAFAEPLGATEQRITEAARAAVWIESASELHLHIDDPAQRILWCC